MSTRKIIAISEENYFLLKKFGMAGDSFNDVMTHILKKIKPQQTEIGVGPRDSVCSGCTVGTDHHQGDDMIR